MAVVLAYSFDMDGCLLHEDYLKQRKAHLERSNIVSRHSLLFNYIKSKRREFKKMEIYLGSNRQGIYEDYSNSDAHQSGSAFHHLNQIGKYFDIEPKKFLMTDLYNNLEDGTTYNEALDYLDEHGQYIKKVDNKTIKYWLFDEHKFSILYAQIQQLAEENPNDDIEYNFLDDRTDILESLINAFTKYPKSIPANVTLNLLHYDIKCTPTLTASIKGTGKADKNYRETVKRMAEQHIQSKYFQDKSPTAGFEQVKSYADAHKGNFLLSENMNIVNTLGIPLPELKETHSNSETKLKATRSNSERKLNFFSKKTDHSPSETGTSNSTSPLSPRVIFESGSKFVTRLKKPGKSKSHSSSAIPTRSEQVGTSGSSNAAPTVVTPVSLFKSAEVKTTTPRSTVQMGTQRS